MTPPPRHRNARDNRGGDRADGAPRKKRRWGRRLAAAVFIVMLAVAVAARWGTPRLEAWLATRLSVSLAELTGCVAEVPSTDVEIFPLWVTLRALHMGCDGAGAVQVDEVRARVLIWPLLRGQIVLARLEVKRPSVDIDAAGPWPRVSSGAGAGQDDMGFTVGSLVLTDGSVTFVDAAGGRRLTARGFDVRADSFFDGHALAAVVNAPQVAAEASSVSMQDAALRAEIRLEGGVLQVERLDLDAANLGKLEASGQVTFAADAALPRYDLRVDWNGQGGDLTALLASSEWLAVSGPLRWSGRVHGDGARWRLDGDVLMDTVDLDGVALTGVGASGHLDPGTASLETIRARVLDGTLEGRLGVEGWPDQALLDLAGRIENVDVDAALRAYLGDGWPDVGARLDVTARGQVPVDDPASVEGALEMSIYPGRGYSSINSQVPVGVVDADVGRGAMRVTDGRLAVGGVGLELGGDLRFDGELDGNAIVNVLDLAASLASLEPSFPDLGVVNALAPAGALRWEGTLWGDLVSPRAGGIVNGFGLSLAGLNLGQLTGTLRLEEDRLRFEDIELTGDVTDLRMDVDVPLHAPAEWTATWETTRLDIEPLGLTLGLPWFASGELAGRGQAWGGTGGPNVVGDLGGEALGLPGWLELDRLALRAELTPEALTVRRFEAGKGGGTLSVDGVVPWNPTATLQVNVRTDRLPLDVLPRLESLDGDITLSLDVVGTPAGPALRAPAVFRVDDLRWQAWGPLTWEGEMTNRDGRLTLAAHETQGRAVVSGQLGPAPEFEFNARLEAAAFETVVWSDATTGDVRVRVGNSALGVTGALRHLDNIRTTAEIGSLAVEVQEVAAESTAPIKIVGTGALMEVPIMPMSVGPQEFTVTARALFSTPPSYELSVQGGSDLKLLQPFIPSARVAGQAALSLHVRGDGSRVGVTGSLDVVDGYLKHDDFPQSLTDIAASIEFDDATTHVRELRGRLGDGEFDAEGELTLGEAAAFAYDMVLVGRRINLRYPEGLSTLTDFNLELSGDESAALLGGDVWLLHGRYTQPLRVVRSMFSSVPSLNIPPAPGPLDDLQLDLDVDGPGNLWLDNDLGKAEFSVHVDVHGSASRPELDGDVELVRVGRVRFQRVDYTLSGGSFRFDPGFPDDPEVDAEARARLEPYLVRVHASGRLSDLRLELSAQPNLAEEEIAAMLLSGGMWRSGTSGGATTAGSTSEDTSASPARWAQAAVDPLFADIQDDPGSTVNLGRQISPRLYSAWSTSLGGAGESAVELRYRVHPHMELRQARDFRGANVSEVRYVRSFDSRGRSNAAEVAAAAADVEGPRVGALYLEGLPESFLDAPIREALELPVGTVLGEHDLLVAASRGRRAVTSQGYPLGHVQCASEPGVNATVDLRCRVEAGPQVTLDIDGSHGKNESQRLRDEILERWMEITTVEDLADEAERTASDFYRDEGRARVMAEAAVVAEEDGLHLRLAIDPGPVVRCTDVRVEGAELLADGEVRDQLAASHRRFLRRPPLTTDLIDADRDRLRRLYYAAGFLDANVPAPQVEFGEAVDEATIVYHVDEGSRRALEAVVLEGNSVFEESELRERFDSTPGDYPDPQALEQAAIAIQQLYHRGGYPDASVSWTLEKTAAASRAVFRVREGDAVRVGAVTIVGIETVRESAVRRVVTLSPGDPFRRDLLLETQQRIRSLGMFESVSVRGEPGVDRPLERDVVIRVRERDDIDLSLGVGFDDEEGGRVSFSLGKHLLTGRPASATFQGRVGGDLTLGQFSTQWRRVGGSRYDLLSTVGLGELERDGFTERSEFFSLQLARRISRRTTALARYRLKDVDLRDVTLTATNIALSEGVIASLGASVVRNGLDDPFQPNSGGIGAVDLTWFTHQVGSEEDFFRAALAQNRFWRLGGGGVTFGTSARVGLAWTLGDTQEIPISERFFAGGIGSVRGFERDTLGPLDPATGDPVGGAAQIILNEELRVPMSRLFSFHFFVDGGNVYSDVNDVELSDLRFSTGPGFSLSTPAGPLRLYYGFKLDREPGEDSGRFHFTFGRVF